VSGTAHFIFHMQIEDVKLIEKSSIILQ